MNRTVKLALVAALSAVVGGCVEQGGEAPVVVVDSTGAIKTPSAAVAKVREMRANGTLKGRPAVIAVKAGRYRLSEPLILTAADSGIVFRGEGYERTVFDGGVELPPFKVGADGVWVAEAKGLREVRQLYVNNRMAQVARSPNKFYYYMEDEDENDVMRSFFANPADVAPLTKLSKAELQRVVVPVWMSWSIGYAEVASLDAAKSIVTLKSDVLKHYNLFYWKTTKPRYALENFRAALDAPGEWFFDREREQMLYIPRAGETPENTRAVVAQCEGLVKIQGRRDANQLVKDVTFEGIGFEHSAFFMGKAGWPQMQSHANIRSAAIAAEDAENVQLVNCGVAHAGALGVLFGKGVRHSTIRHTLIEDLGGGGVYVGDITADMEQPEKNAGFVTIEDSIIRHGGRVFNGANGVWLGKVGDCKVLHNEICDFFYTGVAVGWTWGYAPTVTQRNSIRHNRIHHIGQGVLSDMGAIYTLGHSEGSDFIHNHIWEVNGYAGCGSPAWGMYTDEGSTRFVFADNLVERCRDGAIHQHFGKENVYSNNVCIACGDSHINAQVRRSKHENHTVFELKNNIFVWEDPKAGAISSAYGDFEALSDVKADGNLWWCRGHAITNRPFKGRTWSDWQKLGQDRHGAIADPLFVDYERGDYTLKPDSPALKAGFIPVDWKDCGVLRGDAKWRALSEQRTWSDLEDAPRAPKYVENVNRYGARPIQLTCEYCENPDGVDTLSPRLGWHLPEGVAAQTAYELEIDGKKTGKIAGNAQFGVAWPKVALKSSQRVEWRVRVWDEKGKASAWSKKAHFTMGLLNPSDWQAKWIAADPKTRPDEDMADAQWLEAPTDAKGFAVLERRFQVGELKPEEAVDMVYAGVGEYEITVNGKVFKNVKNGMVQDWRYSQFRNLAPYLAKGENVMTVKVATDKGDSGARGFIGKIVFPDGRRLVTDAAWTSPNGAVKTLGKIRETKFGREVKLRTENASPRFRKRFNLVTIAREATLHITGVGFYEVRINGKKVGAKVLDPSPTVYDKRVLYSTYRVERYLTTGENEIEILLGHGWYDMRSIATWNFETAPWRDFPRAIARLEINMNRKNPQVIVTDQSWEQVKSPVSFDCLFGGEIVGGASKDEPNLEGLKAVAVDGPAGRLVSETHPGAKVMGELKPQKITDLGNGEAIVDFGESITGWIRADFKNLAKGDIVRIRYDERVNDGPRPALRSNNDGLHSRNFSMYVKSTKPGEMIRRVDQHTRYAVAHRVTPLADEMQQDVFIADRAGVGHHEPRFTYNGFRYVYLRGLKAPLGVDDIRACQVRTAFAKVGKFKCSHDGFNRLMEMADRSYRANFTDGVPTDCPHREKNGWTGDAAIAVELAQYLYENTAAYEKWLRDIGDAQIADGNIPCIIPTGGWGFAWGNGPTWDVALPLIAWNLWNYRGDRRILDTVYPTLKKYLAYTATRADADGLTKHGLGDWVPVDRKRQCSSALMSSCYYYQALRIAAEIAAIKGLTRDASAYSAQAARTGDAIHRRFYKGDGVYDNGGQTAEALPLAIGIVPPAELPAVQTRLVKAFEERDCHVDMGILGCKHAFRMLSRIGRPDLAWKTLVNPTWPSMMCWLQKGGTALWEDWYDGASRCHIMFGDFAGWAYQYLAGIRMAEAEGSTSAVTLVKKPGMGELEIAPTFLAELTYLECETETMYGKVAVAWKRDGGKVRGRVTIPGGTTAVLKLPGQRDRTLSSGETTFEF